MPSNKPDPDELIVKTQYFISGETGQANLKKIQEEIIRILQMEGYRQTDIDPLPIGPIQHTMDFRLFDGIPVEDQESVDHIESPQPLPIELESASSMRG